MSTLRNKSLFFRTQWPASLAAVALVLMAGPYSWGETCTPQSQMTSADKDAIVAEVRLLAGLVQASDASGLRAQTVPEYAKDFSAMTALVGSTAPKVQAGPLSIDQVYLLDASNLKTLVDGTNQDAQFFCSLNKSVAETEFLIPSLPPGKYGFAVATAQSAKPWEIAFLLKQELAGTSPRWSMAGLYPKPLTAAGHDGLWYWIHARDLVKEKQLWSGYLYYQEAQALLQPAPFVTSTHLDKLRKETATSAPPALSDGISADAPLVVKGLGGAEYRFTALATDDSLGADKIDILVHLQAEPAAEPPPPGNSSKPAKSGSAKASTPPVTPRERNSSAMAALIAAFPELRANFHGVWVFADAPGGNPFATEEPMANVR